MISLGYSPYILISSFITTLLLDRGVFVTGNQQVPTSSPWYPTSSSSPSAKQSNAELEALKRILPLVNFDCRGKTGYFTDSKFSCEVFHYCQPDGTRNSFHCPENQLFNQLSLICEDKTVHNSRLCKEGSINPTKLQNPHKKYDAAQEKRLLNSSSSKESTKIVMTLQQLLSYMNSGHVGKGAEPTFISLFQMSGEPSNNESAITVTPGLGIDFVTSTSISTDTQLTAEGSDQSFSISKVPSKSGSIPMRKSAKVDDVSAEYDAIEGRKFKEHKRFGQVIDVPMNHHTKKDEKPSARSATDEPFVDDVVTLPPIDDEEPRNSSYHSLFTTDRTKAKEFRKRKRYQGRKRKPTTPGNDTDSDTTVAPGSQTTRQESDAFRNHAHRRRKPQRTRIRDGVTTSSTPADKIEPYTLPPLPTISDQNIYEEEKKDDVHKETRSKNPWHKTTPTPNEEGSIKFGEKLSDSDQHQYQASIKGIESQVHPENYETIDLPNTSEEAIPPSYSERDPVFPKEKHSDSVQFYVRLNDKPPNRIPDEENLRYKPSLDKGHQRFVEQQSFPPSRSESRDYHSTTPQQGAQDSNLNMPKSGYVVPKVTTESPFKVTHPYAMKYNDLNEMEEHRWNMESQSAKPKSKKVAVGSTFYQNEESGETTKKPRLQVTTEMPSVSYQKEKEIHKQMLAHQHLSKIMNDFFAMSSSGSSIRSQASASKDKKEFKMPNYRIPEEDIYSGSEPAAEDMDDLPPELLEVVDLLSAHGIEGNSNLKPTASHEVIKINGPITESHLEKIFSDDENMENEPRADGSYKKIVVVPQPEETEDEVRIANMEEFASLDIASLLKHIHEQESENADQQKHDSDQLSSLDIESILKHVSEQESIKLSPLKVKPLQQKIQTHSGIESLLKYISDQEKIKVHPLKIKQVQQRAPTALNIESLLKYISDQESVKNDPLKQVQTTKSQQTVLTAKKIPVRVIYRDQLTETPQQKTSPKKPNVNLLHSHLPTARHPPMNYLRKGTIRPMSTSFSTHTKPAIVIHPRTLYPPHPPPLPKKQITFRVGYPFVTNSRSLVLNTRRIPRRSKRSIVNRLRRQIAQNQNFLPYSTPIFSAFNPKFVPSFSPFKTYFSPFALHTSSSHMTPFTLPGYSVPKPSQNRPHIYSRPVPISHVTQNGQQAVIVEEVPVPIHVEVPTSNLAPSSQSKPKPRYPNPKPRYPENQYRTPSPPAIQTPPLLQRPQNRYPPPPRSYQHFGMPSNSEAPAINYGQPVSFNPGLPPSITSDGQLYALGVTNKPFHAPKSRPLRPVGPNSGRNVPLPFNPYEIHPSSYPNFPYFQGAFTTPLTNDPIPGRIMYSGYKPPKSTLGTKSPKPRTKSNKERKPSESNPNHSRSKPSKDNYRSSSKPMRESHVSYTEEVISRNKQRPKPNFNDYSLNHSEFKSPSQSLSTIASNEMIPKKRKSGRRRRPRPYSSTTQGTAALNHISPTPPPPEQIPPPPADYTSKPSHTDPMNSLPALNDGAKTQETSTHFPPAGYYGKDQLVQFFDTSSKSYQKSTSPKPNNHRDLGESASSAEIDESFVNVSGEDGDQPAFGTRLKSNPGQSRSRKPNKQPTLSQSQNSEVRTRPHNQQDVPKIQNKKESGQTRPNDGNRMQMKNENHPPKKRRPQLQRPRSRPAPPPPPMTTPHTQIHHYNYNENMANFYSVPRGLQTLIAPERAPGPGFHGSTDMFGLPHPVIDQSIYSLRPKEAPVEFNTNFFSVPAHVSQQQQTPLHKMNIKPIPESARDFFTAPESTPTSNPPENVSEKKEVDQKTAQSKPVGETLEQKENPPVRKLRKPKRKNRYNPHSTEHKDSGEISSPKPQFDQTTSKETNSIKHREKTTTLPPTTTESRPAAPVYIHTQNDVKESPVVFKQRLPLLPKALPEFPKSLPNSNKIDFQKLNATISTSVSISGGAAQNQTSTSSEEKENKRVFSSQNGGLAVVRKGPKRKRARQRVSTTTGVPYINNGDNISDAKYEIAASVLDIIKATTETERQASGYYNKNDNLKSEENMAESKVSNIWVESKRMN